MSDFTPAEAHRIELAAGWEAVRAQVEVFCLSHGRWPQASTNDRDERRLGQWLYKVRADDRKQTLSGDRRAAMEAMSRRVGKDWHTGQSLPRPAAPATPRATPGAAPSDGRGHPSGPPDPVRLAPHWLDTHPASEHLLGHLLDGDGWAEPTFGWRLTTAEHYYTFHGQWPSPTADMDIIADLEPGIDPEEAAALAAGVAALGRWVVLLKRAYLRHHDNPRVITLTEPQREAVAQMLERLATTWTPDYEAQWEHTRGEVEEFHRRHGRWPAPSGREPGEAELGRWLADQRTHETLRKMSEGRRRALNQMGVRVGDAWRNSPRAPRTAQ